MDWLVRHASLKKSNKRVEKLHKPEGEISVFIFRIRRVHLGISGREIMRRIRETNMEVGTTNRLLGTSGSLFDNLLMLR